MKAHLRVMVLDGKPWHVLTLRPGSEASFSTNFFHDTWHIVSDADGAKLLARVFWAMSYQREPNTIFVIHGDNVAPTPFDADPSLPVVVCPASITAPDEQAFRELKTLLKRLPPPTATVRLQTWGLDAAIADTNAHESDCFGVAPDKLHPHRGGDLWQKEQMTLRGGFICYCASASVLRKQAWMIHGMEGGEWRDYRYLAEHRTHPGDGEVQIFRNYGEKLSVAIEARREVLQAGGGATPEAVWNRAEIVAAGEIAPAKSASGLTTNVPARILPFVSSLPASLARTSAVFFLTALTAPAVSAQTVDKGSASLILRGPLPVRNNEPVNSLFLLPVPVQAGTLTRNRATLDLNIDIPNNFLTIASAGYYADFEDQRVTLDYRRGLGGGSDISLRLPYVGRNGGITDGLIDGWHNAFNIYGGGRGNFAHNQVRFDLRDAQTGQIVSQTTQSVSGFGDAIIEYRRSFTGGVPGFDAETGAPDPRRVMLTARALLKLPTGSAKNLLGSGGTDTGLGIAASARPFRRVAFHGNLAVVWHGKTDIDALSSRSTSVHSMAAIEWLMNGRTSFLAQVDNAPAPHRTGSDYVDRERRMFTFGLWRQITPRQNLYLSLGENDFGFAAHLAPDLQLSAGTRFAL